MKKIKNFWFYTGAFFIYVFLAAFFSIIASAFLSKSVYGFLIRNFSSVGSLSANDTVLVVIDDESNDKYPDDWGLEKIPAMLDYFDKYAKPLSVGLDTCASSFDPKDIRHIKRLNKYVSMKNMTTGFIPSDDNDSGKPFFEKFKKYQKLDTEIISKDDYPKSFRGVSNVSEDIVSKDINYASIYFSVDSDTKQVYNYVYVVRIGNDFYPSLALKMYLVLHNTNRIVLDGNKIIVPKTGLVIPVSYSSNALLHYDPAQMVLKTPINFHQSIQQGTTAYSHIPWPAYRILETYSALERGITPQNHPELYDLEKNFKTAFLNPEMFKNKVVFIGTNVSGANPDVYKTPMGDRHPGVDIQATAFDNLIVSDFLHKDGILIFCITLFSFLLMSVCTFSIILKSKMLKGLLSIAGLNVLYLLLIAVFAICGYIINPVCPVSVEVVTLVFGYSFKFITENRNKEKIKAAMGKYLSQDIMKNVVSNIDDLKLGGKRAVVTVLFSDIRGFTSMSEKMPAEDVTKILNEYFTEMEPIITKYNGVINKFIGDAVMAIFGEPVPDSNHPVNAVRCAYEMLLKVEYLREKWLREGKPKIEIGIGICTGEVFIGNIGSEARMEYTVIGDTVNLASRIEGYNKVYKTNLLVSSSTYSGIADIADVIKISEVKIRGKAQKMNIYEVLRIERPDNTPQNNL